MFKMPSNALLCSTPSVEMHILNQTAKALTMQNQFSKTNSLFIFLLALNKWFQSRAIYYGKGISSSELVITTAKNVVITFTCQGLLFYCSVMFTVISHCYLSGRSGHYTVEFILKLLIISQFGIFGI